MQDNVLPIVSWSAPVMDGATHSVSSGIVTLAANASDNSGIAQVGFTRWDAVNSQWVTVATDTAAPWPTSTCPR